jgi:predicted AlkP superfamily pyrophosphatase or phosphodiesterase
MKRHLWVSLVSVLTVTASSPGQTRPAARPAVLMVSIDGMRADYLADADRYGLKLPVLRKLMWEGVAARRMIPIYPSVTYPAHTSLITGCRPAKHGVLGNEPFQPLVEGRTDWYWFDRYIRVTTLHRAFKQAGLTTAAVSWPVTVGAKTLDYNAPEYWEAANFDGSFLIKTQEASTPGLIEAAEKRFGFKPDLTHADEMKTLIARHIVLAYRPDLLLLHLADLDKKQHLNGPGTPEVLATLEKADHLIGELLDSYREAGMTDRLIAVVVSDHGFEAVDHEFRPNAVLRPSEAGKPRPGSMEDRP